MAVLGKGGSWVPFGGGRSRCEEFIEDSERCGEDRGVGIERRDVAEGSLDPRESLWKSLVVSIIIGRGLKE
jgi:hypothetical protein